MGVELVKLETTGKCYFRGSDGKICGEGFDEGWDFSEGFAVVKRDGKYYFVDDKDFKLHGEGYDDANFFSEGFAPVKKDGKWYFVDKTFFNLHGKGYKETNCVFSRLYAVYKIYKSIKKNGKKIEELDYLQEAKDDVKSIVGIPATLFSNRFAKKLKEIVLDYYEDKIKNSDNKDYNDIEQEMNFIKETIQSKQEQYQAEKAKEEEQKANIEQRQETLLKQARTLFAGDAKSVGSKLFKQPSQESSQNDSEQGEENE